MSERVLPASLREALTAGRVVPFVGAGVSMAVKLESGQPAFPSWHGLLLQAADRIDAEQRDGGAVVRTMLDMRAPNYMDAARYARGGLGNLWADFLSEVFNVRRGTVDPASLELARLVWALDSKLVITTNYDRVLRWTCPNRDDLEEVDIEAPTQLLAATRGTLERPTIWHLHGSVSEPSNIILSPDGYEPLYSDDRQRSKYEAALTTLRTLIASKTLLFVGFSLDDPYFVRQLEWARDVFKGLAGPHYILVRERDAGPRRARYAELGVDVVTFEEFGEPLRRRLGELQASVGEPVPSPVEPVEEPPRPQQPSVDDVSMGSKPAMSSGPQAAEQSRVASRSGRSPTAKTIVFGSLGIGVAVFSLAVFASANEPHEACESFSTQGNLLQLASYKNAEHAMSQATKLEREVSARGLPGEAFLLVKGEHVVVGLTGFPSGEAAEEYKSQAKEVLDQGGYNKAWERFCDGVWSSKDRAAKASLATPGFESLAFAEYCFCQKPGSR